MSATEERVIITFREDIEIIQQIDALAKREGTDRSAIFRRALRRELLLSSAFTPRVPVASEPSIDHGVEK